SVALTCDKTTRSASTVPTGLICGSRLIPPSSHVNDMSRDPAPWLHQSVRGDLGFGFARASSQYRQLRQILLEHIHASVRYGTAIDPKSAQCGQPSQLLEA